MQQDENNKEINPDGLIRAMQTEPRDEKYWTPDGKSHAHLPKGIKWAMLGLAVIFVSGSIASIVIARNRVADAIASRAGLLEGGIVDLQNLDPASAEKKFSSLGTGDTQDPGDIFGTIGSIFGKGTGMFQAVNSVSTGLTALAKDLSGLENGAFALIATGKGDGLLSSLSSTKTDLATIDSSSDALSGAASSLGGLSPISGDVYLPFKTQVEGARNFLDAFIPWLATTTPHHVLVLFENPSELRPGGGFLGSYADLTVMGGDITNIAVHDIADVDAGFPKNIVPPKPLQLEVPKFRPADANWFFDFSTSGAKAIELFNASKLYGHASTTFDAVLAISPKVIEDLLSVTGPVTVPGQATAFDSKNFLVQVQKIVQVGQAQSATYPKKVLSDLTGAMFQRIASSTPEERQSLASMALNWTMEKDVMLYFEDPAFERFADMYGLSGAVFQLPQHSNEDYLAVVNANINGDKSDLYVNQNINFEMEINSDGTLTDHLVIDRTHTGDKSPYWWYQTTNQDYLQVFVPSGAALDNANGGATKTISAPLNYAKSGYLIDPAIDASESTMQTFVGYPSIFYHDEAGKRVFSTWVITRAGKKSELSLDYSRRLFEPPAAGEKYEFVFEKQSGAQGNYKFTINAPLGFKFLENNLPSYELTSSDPPGRLVIDLTLAKI